VSQQQLDEGAARCPVVERAAGLIVTLEKFGGNEVRELALAILRGHRLETEPGDLAGVISGSVARRGTAAQSAHLLIVSCGYWACRAAPPGWRVASELLRVNAEQTGGQARRAFTP